MLPPKTDQDVSRRFVGLAQGFAKRCPADFADIIAITGSAARGTATRLSDLDLNLWSTEIPPWSQREAWLRSLGAEVQMREPKVLGDGGEVISCRVDDITLEVSWGTVDGLGEAIDSILAGTNPSYLTNLMPGVICDALPLRDNHAVLHDAVASCAHYPDAAQYAILEEATRTWTIPARVAQIITSARKNEHIDVSIRLTSNLSRMVRILFALNREWEVVPKRAFDVLTGFSVQPSRFSDRAASVMWNASPKEAIRECLQLMIDVLALVPRDLCSVSIKASQDTLREVLNSVEGAGRASLSL